MEDSSGGKLLSDAEKEKVRGGASLQEGIPCPWCPRPSSLACVFPPLSSSRGTLQEQTLPCSSDRYLKSNFCTMQDVVTRHPHSPLRTPKRNRSLWSLPIAPRVYLPPPINPLRNRQGYLGRREFIYGGPAQLPFTRLPYIPADLEYSVE